MVGQTLLHVHLVANVEVGDVGWVDLGPLELVLVTHVDPGLTIIGKCCQELNQSLRELEIISIKRSEQPLKDWEQVNEIIT